MEDIHKIEDLHQLSSGLVELKNISKVCFKYDYDDNSYGTFCVGPEDAHKINSKLMRENSILIKEECVEH